MTMTRLIGRIRRLERSAAATAALDPRMIAMEETRLARLIDTDAEASAAGDALCRMMTGRDQPMAWAAADPEAGRLTSIIASRLKVLLSGDGQGDRACA